MTNTQMNHLVQTEVNRGARVEYQTGDSVTLSYGKPVNHILHLIVSILIAPWAIVWLIFELTGGVKREVIRIAPDGGILRETVAGSGNPLWAKIVSGAIVVLWLVLLTQVF